MDPKQTTSLCSSCPKLCRFSCPVSDAEQDESTTPWGKMSAMKLVEEGKIAWNAKSASLAYKCLQCGASEEVCELHNPVPETLEKYRIKAFQTGIAPAPIYPYLKNFQEKNGPYPTDLFDKLKRSCPEEMKRPQEKIAYFPGCDEIQNDPATIKRTLSLLRKLGTRISLYQEPILCCGYPLYAAGDIDSFRELAEINIPALKKYREVWSGNATCLNTMEFLYRELGYSFSTKFFHVVEKISPLLDGGHRGRAGSPPIKARIPAVPKAGSERIAYHDPCSLGRFRKIYDAPRKIIEQVTGQPPIEFRRNREGSTCCGAGGLLPITSPETSESITKNRLQEFREAGAEVLVTACPSCVHQFKKVDPKLNVVSLINFMMGH